MGYEFAQTFVVCALQFQLSLSLPFCVEFTFHETLWDTLLNNETISKNSFELIAN